MNQPTPPPGMRILSDEELTKPLPMDAVWWRSDKEDWATSLYRGKKGLYGVIYATATPPPTDWRKMCEELAKQLATSQAELKLLSVGEQCDHSVGICWCGLFRVIDDNEATLTRAKAALEESK